VAGGTMTDMQHLAVFGALIALAAPAPATAASA
jgi:hypothetical protein